MEMEDQLEQQRNASSPIGNRNVVGNTDSVSATANYNRGHVTLCKPSIQLFYGTKIQHEIVRHITYKDAQIHKSELL